MSQDPDSDFDLLRQLPEGAVGADREVALRLALLRLSKDVRELNSCLVGLRQEVEAFKHDLLGHFESTLAEPPKLEKHWMFGHGVFMRETRDKAVKTIGNWVFSVLGVALLAALVSIAIWFKVKGVL